MTLRRFYLELILLTAACAGLLAWAHTLPALRGYGTLSWVSLAFFFLLTAGLYHLGRTALASDNQKAFSQLVLVATVGKMMAAVLIVLIYMRLVQPATKWFVAPFLGLYLVYTAYETYMMMTLGKSKT